VKARSPLLVNSSKDIPENFPSNSKSHCFQRALSALMEKEILSKNGTYQFQDAMLKKWIQHLS
jgi:hypothetical protein